MSASLLLTASRKSIDRAASKFLSLQHPDGYWCALLTADTTLESDYILFQLWLHPPDADGKWNPPSRGKIGRAAQRILSQQNADGGFAIYAKGPSEISASVKAYFALKLVPGRSRLASRHAPFAFARMHSLSRRRPGR